MVATFVIGLLAVGAVAFSDLPQGWRLGLTVMVATVWSQCLRIQFSAAALRCALQPEGDWLITDGTVETKATLLRSHDLGFLITLHFRTDSGRRIDLALWPDSIPLDARRRLRVWLG